ncbi:hypothetical protein EJ04DRAFT_517937 [Polyplosphaeria fusca]|uniref:Uncharacterized protein n=1 Tax=Polyplosphaeria fusca TaxID=682080 RepID=A0A9P4VA87_9PLEO|nr:hypothetical protein EJ04DRAFT_517937 [Polyplosphaeria fusca]
MQAKRASSAGFGEPRSALDGGSRAAKQQQQRRRGGAACGEGRAAWQTAGQQRAWLQALRAAGVGSWGLAWAGSWGLRAPMANGCSSRRTWGGTVRLALESAHPIIAARCTSSLTTTLRLRINPRQPSQPSFAALRPDAALRPARHASALRATLTLLPPRPPAPPPVAVEPSPLVTGLLVLEDENDDLDDVSPSALAAHRIPIARPPPAPPCPARLLRVLLPDPRPDGATCRPPPIAPSPGGAIASALVAFLPRAADHVQRHLPRPPPRPPACPPSPSAARSRRCSTGWVSWGTGSTLPFQVPSRTNGHFSPTPTVVW